MNADANHTRANILKRHKIPFIQTEFNAGSVQCHNLHLHLCYRMAAPTRWCRKTGWPDMRSRRSSAFACQSKRRTSLHSRRRSADRCCMCRMSADNRPPARMGCCIWPMCRCTPCLPGMFRLGQRLRRHRRWKRRFDSGKRRRTMCRTGCMWPWLCPPKWPAH